MRRLPLRNSIFSVHLETPSFPLPRREEIIVFPDGHLNKGTLAIIKDGFINVNASGLPREGLNVYLLENKGFFLTG